MSDAAFVYDDDCGFCTWWAALFDDHADVRIVGFSDLDPDLRTRLPEDYEECSHLVTDGVVRSCGASIEEALLRTEVGSFARPVAEFLRGIETYRAVRERGYRAVAHSRDRWGKLLSKRPPARGSNS